MCPGRRFLPAGYNRRDYDTLIARRMPLSSLAPPELALIAAVAKNGVIGAHGALPWRLPDDLRRFRALTTGHTVVMGRKTWESLARALPERQNIVVTRQPEYRAAGATIAATLEDALARAARPAPIFCIGGGELYRAALPRADTLQLTEIDREFDGDAWFPAFDRKRWQETARSAHRLDGPDGFAYAFVTYRRRAD
jgi:dihydrofolate reductase